MNPRLALAALWVPGSVRRKKLVELLRRTADAFGATAPDVADQSLAECLRTFAAFSSQQAERALAGAAPAPGGAAGAPAAPAAALRLRAGARELGAGMRQELRIHDRGEAMRAARLLYRALGIDFRGDAQGRIAIRRCYFADWYSPRACALMSALDEGLLAGLAGEGRLEFASRITEGCDHCAATFHFAEEQP